MTVPWPEAWQQALYGPQGLYRQPRGPAGHFTTATHGATGAVLAEALLAHAESLLGRAPGLVVDVGAGRGELATHLLSAGASQVLALDVVDRPAGLPGAVDWLVSPGGALLPAELSNLGGAAEPVLVVAHEWLDVVPCSVALHRDSQWVALGVDPRSGTEGVVGPLDAAELAWLQQWWPGAGEGARAEVGITRDQAWADLLARVRHGIVVAVDYGHLRDTRPHRGTLTGFRHGRESAPVPDGQHDVTAHVALDSLGGIDLLETQRQAFDRLGLRTDPPEPSLARSDPPGYLRALARASEVAALRDRRGFGGFWWATARVGVGGST